MKVLVVGGGGREHSLAWKLAQSPHVRKVYCAPGNGGTATERKCRNVPIAAWDIESLVEWARNNRPDLTVVGPEDALFRNIKGDWPEGLRIWAPNGAQALLERSKSYMRTISTGFRIPSPKSWTFDDPDAATAFLLERGDKTVVVKASGPALGKGVRVCDSLEEAIEAVRRIMIDREFGEEAGEEVVIEERLSGPEMSLIALCGNGRVMPMPTAKDYKRAGNGDTGLNTGGMGCISPNLMGVDYSSNAIRALCDKFIQPIVTRQGYNATLYAGLMFDGNQPKLLEYNCRFGDPETQVQMMRIREDLFELLYDERKFGSEEPQLEPPVSRTAITVVMAANGYPETYPKGEIIEGLDEAAAIENVKIFHAGTLFEEGKVITNGGRVLNVTATGSTIIKARQTAYAAVDLIHWSSGPQFRTDIGQ